MAALFASLLREFINAQPANQPGEQTEGGCGSAGRIYMEIVASTIYAALLWNWEEIKDLPQRILSL